MTRKYVLTVDEFAERIEVSRATAYRMIAEGKGPRTIRVRGVIRIPVNAFERWLEGDENGDDHDAKVAG